MPGELLASFLTYWFLILIYSRLNIRRVYRHFLWGGRGHWTVNYTGPHYYLFVGFKILIGWFEYFSVQTIKLIILTNRRVNLVYHRWGFI